MGRTGRDHTVFPIMLMVYGVELVMMFYPKGPFDYLTGILGNWMPLLSALVVDQELQDARKRLERDNLNARILNRLLRSQ